ncbi:MAG: Ni/Fe hydrogenase subunit alpha [Anaerolineales bacterium]|nr:Ni/Fe hydrogenase subunit alpha [Anaerolineales bacterium]
MSKTILIDPVTRIEGHSRITIYLDDHGQVQDAHFHVTQLRGFEKLCEGRPFTEMPALMARICGICPVSHLVASAKACDTLMAVQIPPAGANLRRILNLAQLVQSHALAFFHLAAPDFLLGMDGDPAQRNVLGMLALRPELARDGIRLRQIGQQIIALIGGKRVHPPNIVPGGVSQPLTPAVRDRILADLPEALAIAERALAWFGSQTARFTEEVRHFGSFPTMFLGLVGSDGGLEHYDGRLRLLSSEGAVIADQLDPANYADYLGEAVEPHSYLKFPYYKPLGYPVGAYRVGPLARLNLAAHCGTPRADAARASLRQKEGVLRSSFYYHEARLIEILYGVEKLQQLLEDPATSDSHVRAFASPNRHEGVGVSEAPRGTLIHHYKIDDDGLITWANLIIATGHNNLAMNQSVLQVAKHFVKSQALTEGMLNRVEAVIRAYDPCLSCSTHAAGQLALAIELRGPGGDVLDTLQRG